MRICSLSGRARELVNFSDMFVKFKHFNVLSMLNVLNKLN